MRKPIYLALILGLILSFLPFRVQSGGLCQDYRYYFPFIQRGDAMAKSALEQIENLTRQKADLPYDGWVSSVYPGHVTVRLARTNRVKRNVVIPKHINPDDIKPGVAVKMTDHQGQPTLVSIFPGLDNAASYASQGSVTPDPPLPYVRASGKGWTVRWNPVAKADRYRLYRNDTASATTPDDLGFTTKTEMLVPHEDPYRYFAVQAYAGLKKSILSAWTTDTAPPPTPGIVVKAHTNGAQIEVSNLDVHIVTQEVKCLEIQQADDGSGTNATTIATNVGLAELPYVVQISGYPKTKYFRIRALDYADNPSEWTAWTTDTTPPPVPDSLTALDAINRHEIYLSWNDVSARDVGFYQWEIQQATNSAGANSVTLGYFTATQMPVVVPISANATRYYRARAYDSFGNVSTWSGWETATAGAAEVQDQFDNYGGKDFSSVENLYFLQVDELEEVWPETADGWLSYQSYQTAVKDTTHLKQGANSIGIELNLSGSDVWLRRDFSPALDFSQDSRFTDDDYIIFSLYLSSNFTRSGESVYLYLHSSSSTSTDRFYGTFSLAGAEVGAWNHFAIQRGDLGSSGSANWSSIRAITLAMTSPGSTSEYWAFDDLRIVKADPDNVNVPNDTGEAWDFSAHTGSDQGQWHIYHGKRPGEPDRPFSLGQIYEDSSPGRWYIAHKPMGTVNIYTGTVQTGLHLKTTDGRAGLAFYINDATPNSWDMYAIEAIPSSNEIRLVIWEGGSRSTLAIGSFAFAANETVWLGVDLRQYQSHGGRLKVYASHSEGNLIQSANLVLSTQDTTRLTNPGGSIGLISYQANVRFVSVVGGSPAHAEVADLARALDGPIVAGVTKRVRFDPITGWFQESNDAGSSYAGLPAVGAVNVTKYVGPGREFQTIQQAINWFEGKVAVGCTISIDPGTYTEALSFTNCLAGYPNDFSLVGDSRRIVGHTYIDGATDTNERGWSYIGTGAVSLSRSGNTVTVSCSGSQPNFASAELVSGDRVLIRDNSGTMAEYTISSRSGNTLTMTTSVPALGNTGTFITILPNVVVQPTTGTSLVVRAPLWIQGIHIKGATGDANPYGLFVESLCKIDGVVCSAAYGGLYISSGHVLSNGTGGNSFVNTTLGARATCGRVSLPYNYFAGNTHGLYLDYLSHASVGYSQFASNTNGMYVTYNSAAHAVYCHALNNTTGYHALNNSYINATATLPNCVSNSTNHSPAPSNAVGNNESTISIT